MAIMRGNLLTLALEGHFDVVVHGCNCFCTMGAGIAKEVRGRFPEAYEADLSTRAGDPAKLGHFSAANIVRGKVAFVVVNAYTQFDWRGRGPKVDYQAIETVFGKISHEYGGLRIGYPRIGAGLAGGDWTRISRIIDTALTSERHALVELDPSVG